MCCEQGKEKEKEKSMQVLCVASFRIPKCGCRYKRPREPQGHGRGHYPYRRRKRLTSHTEALQMCLQRCFSRGSPSSLLPLGHEHTSCISLLFLFGGTGRGPRLPTPEGGIVGEKSDLEEGAELEPALLYGHTAPQCGPPAILQFTSRELHPSRPWPLSTEPPCSILSVKTSFRTHFNHLDPGTRQLLPASLTWRSVPQCPVCRGRFGAANRQGGGG